MVMPLPRLRNDEPGVRLSIRSCRLIIKRHSPAISTVFSLRQAPSQSRGLHNVSRLRSENGQRAVPDRQTLKRSRKTALRRSVGWRKGASRWGVDWLGRWNGVWLPRSSCAWLKVRWRPSSAREGRSNSRKSVQQVQWFLSTPNTRCRCRVTHIWLSALSQQTKVLQCTSSQPH